MDVTSRGVTSSIQAAWPWCDHPWEPRVRYASLMATSPTYGSVTVVIVDEPGKERWYLMCLATPMSATQMIRQWRRSWIRHGFRTLKHLLVAEACQVQSEDVYDGHLIW